MPNDPKPLSIFAAEEIMTGDSMVGTPPPPKQLTREQAEAVMAKFIRLMERYVAPHNKRSRWIKDEDLERVVAEAAVMRDLGKYPRGRSGSAIALAHMQIEANDPLRFFVFIPTGQLFINPMLKSFPSEKKEEQYEGCMSFPLENAVKISRHPRVDMSYQVIIQDEGGRPTLSKPIITTVYGYEARVYQHEVGHLNGCNIYDKDFDADKSIGLGYGKPIKKLLKLYE